MFNDVTHLKTPKEELKDKLYDYYIKQNLTVSNVARKLNMTFESAKYHLSKFGIKKDKGSAYRSFSRPTYFYTSTTKVAPPNLELLERMKNIDIYNVPDEVMYVKPVNNTYYSEDGEELNREEYEEKKYLDREESKKLLKERIRRILKRRREEKE